MGNKGDEKKEEESQGPTPLFPEMEDGDSPSSPLKGSSETGDAKMHFPDMSFSLQSRLRTRDSKDSTDSGDVGWNLLFKRVLNMNNEKMGRVSYFDRLQPAKVRSPSTKAASISEHAYIRLQPTRDLFLHSAQEEETVEVSRAIQHLLALRSAWIIDYPQIEPVSVYYNSEIYENGNGSNEPLFDPFLIPLLEPCEAEIYIEKGVFMVYWEPNSEESLKNSLEEGGKQEEGRYKQLEYYCPIPSVNEFLKALRDVMTAVQSPACKTFCFQRLRFLEERFKLHLMFNGSSETQETMENRHRDFYNVRKVDTHVHHSACMQQKHLLRFIRKKYKTEGDLVVSKSDGRELKLKEIFQRDLGLVAHEISADSLNVSALGSCFQRFDRFNSKYNPFGQKLLREVFLKTDNYIQGRYLAEITREVIDDLEDSKYQHVEWRISIYGKSYDEWEKLAKWVVLNKLHSRRVRWIIQVPRLYSLYKKMGIVKNFEELLKNIFGPVFEAVKNPKAYPEIFYLLAQTVAWDSVDDESLASKYTTDGGDLPNPKDWDSNYNPPYSYWGYHMYANIRTLNDFLHARGLRTLAFRPHCGEAGSISHLATMYLLANGINHGVMLRKSPVLEYLFYLKRIGLAMSPLSNNALFIELSKSPFDAFHRIGLNVSLSTDDPLMFHFTDEALLEEYSLSAHFWKLSVTDLCEIARNSVIQSGWETQYKKHWIGNSYESSDSESNDIVKTNLSNIRHRYRIDTLREELHYLTQITTIHDELEKMPLSAPVRLLTARFGQAKTSHK